MLIIVAVDASVLERGAVILHQLPGATEAIMNASRTLTSAEKKYSQVKMESLPCLCCSSFQQVLIWSRIYSSNRPQASYSFWFKIWCPNPFFKSSLAMGLGTIGSRFRNSVPMHPILWSGGRFVTTYQWTLRQRKTCLSLRFRQKITQNVNRRLPFVLCEFQHRRSKLLPGMIRSLRRR